MSRNETSWKYLSWKITVKDIFDEQKLYFVGGGVAGYDWHKFTL